MTYYVRLIFGGKVLNYERHLTYFQFLIFRKIIESSLEDLKCTLVTTMTQESRKLRWMRNARNRKEGTSHNLSIVQKVDIGAY